MQKFKDIITEGIHKGTVLWDEPMKDHTSFRVGGPADLFVEPASLEEICFALRCARENEVPFFVTGNGTNLLVSDQGFRGMILHIGSAFSDLSVSGNEITVQSGSSLARVAKEALDHSLTGMEFAAGIPGSVGGAVAMNAGAYDGEIKQVLKQAEVLTEDGEVLCLSAGDLDLSYRHSCVFEKGYLVVSATFALTEGDPDRIRERMDELAHLRRSKQPLEYPSAGSTFKRPEGYFAGKLIQDAGLKGYTIGGAQVSIKHSGFVVNLGDATADDISRLIADVQRIVRQEFGVTMHPEVRFIGFDDSEVTR